MTDTNIAQTTPVLVAIDISKVRHEVLIAVPGKKHRRRLTVLNQLDDFNRLGEAVGLKISDIVLDESKPHISIRPIEARSLKTTGSERTVPLIRAALWAAKRALTNAKGDFFFPGIATIPKGHQGQSRPLRLRSS